MKKPLYIESIGSYIPNKKITNKDLCSYLETSEEWIETRTGIKARHILEEHENVADAGFVAAQKALINASIAKEKITHVIVATCTPAFLCPSTACIIIDKLGIKNVMAFDINAACSGFIYGINVFKNLLLDTDGYGLLICSEALSRKTNWNDRQTCILFGDGASALVVSNKKSKKTIAQVFDSCCHANGTNNNLLKIGGGSDCSYVPGTIIDDNFFITMEGQEVFKYAVRNLTNVCQEILLQNKMTINDIDFFIPHQANQRIIEAVGERIHIPKEKTFINLDEYGNTSSASIPLATDDALQQKRIPSGSYVLQATFGGGFTWGAAILYFY